MWVPLGFVFMVQSQSASEDPLVPCYVRFHLPLDFDDHRAALFEYSITSVYIGTTWMGNRDDQLNRWLRLRRGGDVALQRLGEAAAPVASRLPPISVTRGEARTKEHQGLT